MSAPYVLPRAKKRLPDEPLASLVLRNAAPYAFADPMLVLWRLRLSMHRLPALVHERPAPAAATALARLLDVDDATLEQLSCWGTVPGMASVGGRPVLPRLLHVTERRICVACLRESPHHRALWDVVAIRTCAAHGVPLLERCPGCGRPLQWTGHRLDRCGRQDCTYDLRTASVPMETAPPAYVTGLTDLYKAGPSATLPGCELGFGRAVEAALALGTFATRTGKLGRADAFLRRDRERAAKVMQAGWEVLQEWPSGLHRLLADLQADASRRHGRYGLRREFGGVTNWLSGLAGEPWATPLREAFASFLASREDLRATAKALRRFGPPEALRNGHMTSRDAAEYLGIGPETMAELAKREGLYLVRQRAGAGTPSLLRADLVRALRFRKDETLLKDEARAILGVSRNVLKHMEKAGFLGTLDADRRVTHQRAFSREDVEGIVRRTRSAIRPARPGTRLVSLGGAAAGRRSVVDIVRAILDGRLHPRGSRRGMSGLGALLFDTREVERILAPPRKTLPLVAASARLGIETRSVRAWAAEGYLPVVASASPLERGSRVTEEGLAAFEAEFVTAVEIGKLASTTGRWAADRLHFLGYSPVPSASATGLYRRSEVTPAVVETLAARRRKVTRAESAKEAFDMARRVGEAVGAELGADLRRTWNGFGDADGSTYVQVIVGRRQRFGSKYVFRFNPVVRRRLDGARAGWLALALADQDSYLLFPWDEASDLVGEDGGNRHVISCAVDARGRAETPEVAARQRWLPDKTG